MLSVRPLLRTAEIADVVLRHLNRHLPPPMPLESMLRREVIRLLDSAIVIEDPLTPFTPPGPPKAVTPLPQSAVVTAIDKLIECVHREGFARYFLPMVGLFGTLMVHLTGSAEQRALASAWSDSGLGCAFLMTDRGGPSLARWHSILDCTQTPWRLTVAKIWCIAAASADFAILVAVRPGGLVPTALLVEPGAYRKLTRSSVGMPYLDGAVQLGSCSGSLDVTDSCVLRSGGLLAVKLHLTVVRPRFVRAVLAHVLWLESARRLDLSAVQHESIVFLRTIAERLCRQMQFSSHVEDEVLALKLAMNTLLTDIVQAGTLEDPLDERDLLGFTKMEGSSYRCFHEIFTHGQVMRSG
jgi:hypothetical protein